MSSIPWMEPSLTFRADGPFRKLVMAYAIQLHGHREMISRGIGYGLSPFSPIEVAQLLTNQEASEPSSVKMVSDIRTVLNGSPTPLLLNQKLASVVADRITIDVDRLALDLFHSGKLADWKDLNEIASCGLLMLAWEATHAARMLDPSHPTWQFFRHVRNAAAHNGRIELKSGQPDKSAHWRGITISPSSHGIHLFVYPPQVGLLSPGDCLYLLADIEAVFLT